MNIFYWLLLFLNYLVVSTTINPKENVLTPSNAEDMIDPVLATSTTEEEKDPGTERVIPQG